MKRTKSILIAVVLLALGFAAGAFTACIAWRKVMSSFAASALRVIATDARQLQGGQAEAVLARKKMSISGLVQQLHSADRRYLPEAVYNDALWRVARFYGDAELPVPASLQPILAALPPDPRANFKSLRDQRAADFELDLVGGGRVKLSEHQGKDVVILDFWATWCGPCRAFMPIAQKVAQKFKDQGVVLYAVNIKETPEQIQAFLKEKDLNMAVALDRDGDVGRTYGGAIPTTVIIARDGIIKAHHVGWMSEEKLTRTVTAVLETETAEQALSVHRAYRRP